MDKIICVGKNYLEHARELGDAVPEKPVLFLKPWSSLLEVRGKDPHPTQSLSARLPQGRGEAHHECEIVLKLAGGGMNLSLEDARKSIYAVTLGLDMTLRDLQTKLKKAGHPWEVSKVFEHAAITGPWVAVDEFPGWEEEEFSLSIDGELRQKGRATQMGLSVAECVAYASQFFPILPGDLLFTGTPAGVGPVKPGSHAELKWGSRLSFSLNWLDGQG